MGTSSRFCAVSVSWMTMGIFRLTWSGTSPALVELRAARAHRRDRLRVVAAGAGGEEPPLEHRGTAAAGPVDDEVRPGEAPHRTGAPAARLGDGHGLLELAAHLDEAVLPRALELERAGPAEVDGIARRDEERGVGPEVPQEPRAERE